MPVRVSPSDAMTKWVDHLSRANQDIINGVKNVKVAPGVSAAKSFQRWVNAMADPTIQQKWLSRVQAVPLETWQSRMIDVGVPRIAAGAQAKKDNYLNFAEKFFPVLSRNVAQVEGMDNSSFAARVQRAVQMMTLNHEFKLT